METDDGDCGEVGEASLVGAGVGCCDETSGKAGDVDDDISCHDEGGSKRGSG